ncbi:MAG TPA: acyl-CoA dehydrogenase family protein [Sphingobium sp.]|uniref:acyl-CoA dehydrogenase family protein n=1 Tax=Sphingobium sp. TaxID=1912891 RepID=UPI002ED0597D
MNFELSEDQSLLMTSFEALLERFRNPPHGEHGYVSYGEALQAEVQQSGFLEIASQEGFGTLDAALLVHAAAACPVSVEIASSALIGPLLEGRAAPLAIGWGLGKPMRYLPQAKTVCIIKGNDVLVGTPAPTDWEAVGGVVAYPLGILRSLPADTVKVAPDVAAAIRRRALIGIAAEAAGLMKGALDLTVQYVKDRQQFGHPLGHFQGIQHRLAESAQLAHGSRFLALQAAYEDDDKHASIACLYTQEAMRKVNYDCHQFSGAMGLTLEYPLHLWTFRLKFLQGEAGGRASQGQLVADTVWASAAHEADHQPVAAVG